MVFRGVQQAVMHAEASCLKNATVIFCTLPVLDMGDEINQVSELAEMALTAPFGGFACLLPIPAAIVAQSNLCMTITSKMSSLPPKSAKTGAANAHSPN